MTTALRIFLGTTIALIALIVFSAALLSEWLGDLADAFRRSETTK